MNHLKWIFPAVLLLLSPLSEARREDLNTQDMKRLSQEAAKQMTHCEKLQVGLQVSPQDFKNMTSEHVDKDLFAKTLNEAILAIGPSKTGDAPAQLPAPGNIQPTPNEGTRLWAEVGSSMISKGRKTTSTYTLSVYAKDGERQICKVTSELNKFSR